MNSICRSNSPRVAVEHYGHTALSVFSHRDFVTVTHGAFRGQTGIVERVHHNSWLGREIVDSWSYSCRVTSPTTGDDVKVTFPQDWLEFSA